MAISRAMPMPLSLKLLTGGFLAFWAIVAIFPLLWIAVMSIRLPVDAFSSDPLTVLVGPRTKAAAIGLSVLDLALGGLFVVVFARFVSAKAGPLAAWLGREGSALLGWLLSAIVVVLLAVVVFAGLLPAVTGVVRAGISALVNAPNTSIVPRFAELAFLIEPVVGFTGQHYAAVWVKSGFYHNFANSMLVTGGVVAISLTVGTLAGYALARTPSSLAFWLLITALIFRALPHSVLVTGYLPAFINSRDLLMPFWQTPYLGDALKLVWPTPPTLYGKPWAVIAVLVSINQPFTIWMLRSFFQSVPAELDEAARVDGCSHFGAFRRVIMPVMWPGVITTGLFSFLLAYNDYLVCALLLDAQSQTMVPAITQFLNRDTTMADQIEAVAAAVSITAPLFVLVMVFQRQIVSGLTAGAVKG